MYYTYEASSWIILFIGENYSKISWEHSLKDVSEHTAEAPT